MRARLLCAMLLTAGLAGCIGEEELATSSSTPEPARSTLPGDLEMPDAEVVAYNETVVHWRWTDVLRWDPTSAGVTTAQATFSVPGSVGFEVVASAAWEDPNRDLLLKVYDEHTAIRCQDGLSGPQEYTDPPDATCEVRSPLLGSPVQWKVMLQELPRPPDEPFTIDLVLTATDDALDPANAVDWRNLTPPAWQPGDWWEISFTDPTTQEAHQYTAVVAAMEEGQASIGTAHPPSDAVLFHQANPLGRIEAATLGWTVQGASFEPLQFPLEEGDTWGTTIDNRSVEVTVDSLGLRTARLGYTGDGIKIDVRYDPGIGMIQSFRGEAKPWAAFTAESDWEVIDHGSGYDGPVYVPLDRDMVFRSGKDYASPVGESGLVDDPIDIAGGIGYAAESRVYVDVAHGPSHLTLGMFVGWPTESLRPHSGWYHEHAYLPDGIQYEHTVHPNQPAGVHVAYHRTDTAAGEWGFERYSAGPGVSMSQGVAYTLVKYEAPGGQAAVLG